MSEQVFCDYCGYYSTNAEQCTNCGRSLADLPRDPVPFQVPAWGRVKVHLQDPTTTERTWQLIDELWRTKVQTRWPFAEFSEMNKHDLGAGTLEFTGPAFMAKQLQQALQGVGSVIFQELPREQYPQREVPYKFPRPPTVPRGKRKP
jgi:hypothetical protein